jgi:hypothetical protein
MLALAHGDEKQDVNSADTKEQQNSSYKVQRLHAAVLLQSESNRIRSVVADSVVELQNSGRPSCTPTKNKTRIQQMKNYKKIHLTRHSVRTLLFCCRAKAIALAPSLPTWLPPCKTQVGPRARR